MIWVGFVPHSLARNSTFFPVASMGILSFVMYIFNTGGRGS